MLPLIKQLAVLPPVEAFAACTCVRWFSRASSKHREGTLAYEEVTAKDAPLAQDAPSGTAFLLHGLLGSGRNWRSVARRLVNDAAAKHGLSLRLLLCDLRNHGASTALHGLNPPHGLEAAAQDVIHLMQEVLPSGPAPLALIGHSLGGKVALATIRLVQEQGLPLMPQQTWVLDSQPGAVDDDLGGVSQVLELVHEVPLPVPSRAHLQNFMRQRGLSEATSLWLGSNLVANGRGAFRWTFDVQGAGAMYHSYRTTDCIGLLEHPPAGTEIHLVQGEISDRWTPDMVQRLRALAGDAGQGAFHYHLLERAGHNLHVDNAEGLCELLLDGLVRAMKNA